MPKKTAPPPPDLDEDFDYEEDDDEAALEEDREAFMLDEDGEPVDSSWLLSRVGPDGVGDPRQSQARTQLRETLATTPVVNATGIEGADRWLLEVRNEETGQADFLAMVPLNISMPTLCKRFIDAMPDKGDDPVELYFTPIDKTGQKLGAANKPTVITIPWQAAPLLKVREKVARQVAASGGGPNALAIQLLRDQIEESKAARAESQRQLDEERRHRDTLQQQILGQRPIHRAEGVLLLFPFFAISSFS